MNRISLTLMLAATLAATIGCSSKNYVRQQTTPLINKTNELDDLTAKNSKEIKDVDQRAQTGIQGVQTRAAEVDQKALAAGKQADEAQTLANNATTRVDNLTNKGKEELDQLATSVSSTKGYIITVEGGTDSVGPSEYNYDLSQRRANSVIQYLASEKQIPAHKIYLIGLGKDKPVETNKTSEGRKKNRRVDVHLMTNTTGTAPAQAPNTTPAPTANNNPPSSL